MCKLLHALSNHLLFFTFFLWPPAFSRHLEAVVVIVSLSMFSTSSILSFFLLIHLFWHLHLNIPNHYISAPSCHLNFSGIRELPDLVTSAATFTAKPNDTRQWSEIASNHVHRDIVNGIMINSNQIQLLHVGLRLSRVKSRKIFASTIWLNLTIQTMWLP